MPEWLNGAVSKTVVRFTRTEGSNPSLSATVAIFLVIYSPFRPYTRFIAKSTNL